jgi:hypothetical protein
MKLFDRSIRHCDVSLKEFWDVCIRSAQAKNMAPVAILVGGRCVQGLGDAAECRRKHLLRRAPRSTNKVPVREAAIPK